MSDASSRPDRIDFEIAIICAKRIEYEAVEALFDKDWEEEKSYPKRLDDDNEYSMGRICDHNVVLAFMRHIGKVEAANAVAHFRTTFRGIKLCLVVGICGAVPVNPDGQKEIILGDVIISIGVVDYTFGRQYSDKLRKKDDVDSTLGRMSRPIGAFMQKLQAYKCKERLTSRLVANMDNIKEHEPFKSLRYPGAHEDRLYKADYRHKHQNPLATCSTCRDCTSRHHKVCEKALWAWCTELECDTSMLEPRDRLKGFADTPGIPPPLIHFGRVASGDSIMRSSYHRDDIAAECKIIAFEMEGAGVWDTFPTMVVKGVSTYADSHKDDRWQEYAAVRAAACTKAVLSEWRVTEKVISGNYSPLSQATTSVWIAFEYIRHCLLLVVRSREISSFLHLLLSKFHPWLQHVVS